MNSYIASRRGGSRRPSAASGLTDDLEMDDISTIDDSNSDGVHSGPGRERIDWEKDISSDEKQQRTPVLGDRTQRLVDWNVDQLVGLLKRIVANRQGKEQIRLRCWSWLHR